MTFKVSGISAKEFQPFFAMSDAELAANNMTMMIADDSDPGFPCRVSLGHAAPGERVLLTNFEHQPAASPYRSAHAIFVAENSMEADVAVGEVPEPLQVRLLSVRAFDADHMMVDADVIDGSEAAAIFTRFFENDQVEYLQVHYAKRGCYAAHVSRA